MNGWELAGVVVGIVVVLLLVGPAAPALTGFLAVVVGAMGGALVVRGARRVLAERERRSRKGLAVRDRERERREKEA